MPEQSGYYWVRFKPGGPLDMVRVWCPPNRPPTYTPFGVYARGAKCSTHPLAVWQRIDQPDLLHGEQAREGGDG